MGHSLIEYHACDVLSSYWYRMHISSLSDTSLIMNIFFLLVLLDLTYVDELKGQDSSICGISRTKACKSLSHGVQRTSQNGVVFVVGTQKMTKSVRLDRSVTITSKEDDQGRITGDGRLMYAFDNDVDVTLHLSNLVFSSIGVIKTNHVMSIVAVNIHVSNFNHGIFFMEKMENGKQRGFIKLSKSSFVSITGYVLWINYEDNGAIRPFVVNISDSVFTNSGGICAWGMRELNVYNCTFKDYTLSDLYEYYETLQDSRSKRMEELAASDKFGHGVIYISNIDSVSFANCLFTNIVQQKGSTGVIFVQYAQSVNVTSSNFANVKTTKYSSQPSYGSAGFLATANSKMVRISNCTFFNRTADSSDAGFHGCVTALLVERVVIEECTFSECHSGQFGGALTIRSNEHSATVKKSTFLDNIASKRGGAVFIDIELRDRKGNSNINHSVEPARIEHCTFKNNNAGAAGQTLYSNANVDLFDITVEAVDGNESVSHLQLEGELVIMRGVHIKGINEGPIQSMMVKQGIRVSTYDLQIKGEVSYTCPPHFKTDTKHTFYLGVRDPKLPDAPDDNIFTSLVSQCVSCPPQKYMLKAQKITIKPFSKDVTGHNSWDENLSKAQCLKCEPGAICDGDIIPLDNYWGYQWSESTILFTACPPGFCCSSKTTPCKSFDTCKEGRTGKLCGSCKDGYSLSFLSGECVKKLKEKCDLNMFVSVLVGVSLIYSTLFTFLPCIKDIAMNLYAYCKRKPEYEVINGVSIGTRRKDETFSFIAYINIVFFFFQIASLVHVEIPILPGQDTGIIDKIRTFVFNACNFRYVIDRKLCPMDNLTLPVKEFITLGIKLSTIFNVFLFFIVWCCWRLLMYIIRCIQQKYTNEEVEETVQLCDKEGNVQVVIALGDQNTSCPPFPCILKMGFIKLVKLNITSISTMALHMVHCVRIGDHMHMYLYGDLQCYNRWQWLVIGLVIPTVVLYPVAFDVALKFLKKRLLSSKSFLLISLFSNATSGCPNLWSIKKYYGKSFTSVYRFHRPSNEPVDG